MSDRYLDGIDLYKLGYDRKEFTPCDGDRLAEGFALLDDDEYIEHTCRRYSQDFGKKKALDNRPYGFGRRRELD